MRVVRKGPVYAVSRITGPTHNYLGLQLMTSKDERAPRVEALPPIGSCQHPVLDETALVLEVLRGVSDANNDLGCQYSVEAIQYVLNDTPPETVYRGLAALIVREVASGNVVETTTPNTA